MAIGRVILNILSSISFFSEGSGIMREWNGKYLLVFRDVSVGVLDNPFVHTRQSDSYQFRFHFRFQFVRQSIHFVDACWYLYVSIV